MQFVKQDLLSQIDNVLLTFYTSPGINRQLADESRVYEFNIRCLSAIERLAPPGSVYLRYLPDIVNADLAPYQQVDKLAGILIALREDIDSDCLTSYKQLIHADLFQDFLEMAEYLKNEGYKDAAAVIAGGVLEEHLRKLAEKTSIELKFDGKLKMIDRLNADLYKSKSYSSSDSKQVIAWGDIRNKAAHSRYSEYISEQVDLMIQGLKSFIARIPA